jgi:hypothetical protein
MNPHLALSIAYLIAVATESGLTISQVLREVKDTGVVPKEEWDALEEKLKDAQDFWNT